MHHCQELFADLAQKPDYKHISFPLFGIAEHLDACFMPLNFFILLSAESHTKSVRLPWTLGELGENALFIYLQFCISLTYFVCGSRFSCG